MAPTVRPTLMQIDDIQDLFDDIRRDADKANECEAKEDFEKYLQSILSLAGDIQRRLEKL